MYIISTKGGEFMIMGIDVGYSHTKVYSNSGKDIFRSTVTNGFMDININAIKVRIGGNDYTVGENTGAFSVKLNKIDDSVFRLCLYTAIARNIRRDSDDNDVQLVIGLPIQYYKDQKTDLKNALEGTRVSLNLNDRPITFNITKCVVFPQSAGVFVLHPEVFEGSNMVIAIGGMTVDVSYFHDMTLQDFRTYELGMIKLYDKLVQNIKAEFGVSYDILNAEDIIRHKKIYRDGDAIDCSKVVENTLKTHASLIINRVIAGLSQYETSQRHFIGGGSFTLKDFLPSIATKENIFANAEAFYRIGAERFAQ